MTKVERIPCEYKTYSGGRSTIGLNIVIQRSVLGSDAKTALSHADRLFTDTEIKGQIVWQAGAKKDVDGQETLPNVPGDTTTLDIEASVASFNPDGKAIKAKLLMTADEYDKNDLCSFAGESGTLVIRKVAKRERRTPGRPKREKPDDAEISEDPD